MPILVHLALIAVQVLFSSLAIAGKYVLGQVPPVVLVLARVTGAAGVLLMVHRTSGKARVTDKADLVRLFGLGVLGIVANQTLFLLGLARTTAVNASVLVATVPVFTVLNAMLIREEAPNARKILGILAAAAGSVWLIGPGRLTLRSGTAVGDLLILVGMYAYAQYLVLGKRMLRRYDPLTVTTYVMTFAAVGVLPLGLPALAHLDVGAVTPLTWMWVAFIVLGPTLATYFLNIWALERASSNMVAAYIYLQPLLTAAVAPLVLHGEAVTTRVVVGGLGIFAGLGLVIWGERVQRRSVPVAALPGE